MKLRSIDLNLLVVLDALIELRSVRRAGERVGLSQSATSHALDRLRKMLGDDLLVRTSSGMEPTARALGIAGPLKIALQDLETSLVPERFDPAQTRMGMTIAVETYETIAVLPHIIDIFRNEAPGISASVRSGSAEDILAGVDQGRIDIAIGLYHNLPERFMTCRLLSDAHACAMRIDHPLAQDRLDLETYIAAPHLLITMSGGATDTVDTVLGALGRQRDIVMRVPHLLAAVIALSRSDMIATVTRGVASAFSAITPLVVRDLPFDIAPTTFRLVWNRRFNTSPAHIWLRRKLVAIGATCEQVEGHGGHIGDGRLLTGTRRTGTPNGPVRERPIGTPAL